MEGSEGSGNRRKAEDVDTMNGRHRATGRFVATVNAGLREDQEKKRGRQYQLRWISGMGDLRPKSVRKKWF
jgi:hypothetical protein